MVPCCLLGSYRPSNIVNVGTLGKDQGVRVDRDLLGEVKRV